jgi:exopolysaccharide biosynthesis predicted pyruvyltransferase EpsI
VFLLLLGIRLLLNFFVKIFNISYGGLPVYKNIGNKEILGKNRIIFKKACSNKEYIKTKGYLFQYQSIKSNKSINDTVIILC